VVIAALMRRWKSRVPVATTVPTSHVEATAGELAALDAAVRKDR
jgi:hypothetical protein